MCSVVESAQHHRSPLPPLIQHTPAHTDPTPLAPPRTQVADVVVAALVEEAADNKVVEVIAEKGAPKKTLGELFAGVLYN